MSLETFSQLEAGPQGSFSDCRGCMGHRKLLLRVDPQKLAYRVGHSKGCSMCQAPNDNKPDDDDSNVLVVF